MKRQKDIIPETEPPRSEGVQYATGEVVQLLSHVRLFASPWTVAHQASLSFTISQSFLKLMSIELVMPSNHLILYHPLLLLPSFRDAAAAAKSLQSCPTLCDPIDGSPPGSSVYRIFQARTLEWVAIAVSIFPTIRVFSSESVLCIRWPKYWNFSISPSNEYSGLIFFRIDWFDPLAVQGTQESSPTPEFKSINSSALSFPYGPTHIHTWLLEKP